MDAGRVYFSEEAVLMRDMGMAFTDWDVYCVAPITTQSTGDSLQKPAKGQEGAPSPPKPTQGQQSDQASVDLWAVGTNCCRSDDPTFSCGQTKNANARAGLRLVAE